MSEVIAAVAVFVGGLVLGVSFGLAAQSQSTLKDCAKLGATRIDKAVVTCAVRSAP